MKVNQLPFLISLALLVILIVLSPSLFAFEGASATTASWMGLLPGFGIGTILATCTNEEQASSRGLLFVPLAAAAGLVMAVVAWSLTSLADSHAVWSSLIYASVNFGGVYAYIGLIRYIYALELPYSRGTALGAICAIPAFLLLLFPVSLLMHGILSAIWVALFGLGIAKFSSRRKRTNRNT